MRRSARVLDDQHPWPHLESFNENGRAYFRGRDDDIEELLRLIESSTLTLLYGLAGLGKTSLLQAGIFPRLRDAQWLPVPVRLDFRASADPLLEQVYDALEAVVGQPAMAERGEHETLWEFFHRRDVVFLNERHRAVRPVLVFDQFEELFTIGKDLVAGRPEFLAQLASLAAGAPSTEVLDYLTTHPDVAARIEPRRHRYAIVLSLREDYLAELDALRAFYPALDPSRKRLTRMNGQQAMEVLAAGAAVVEPETAQKIVNFVGTGDPASKQQLDEMEVDPALLSVVCAELNEKRIAAEMPRIDEGLLERNRDSILTDFYRAAMGKFRDNPRVQTFVEEGLLSPKGHRDSMSEDQAQQQFGVDPATIDTLIDERLVRIEPRGRTRRIELTHDLLTDVIKKSRDRRREEEKKAAEEERDRAKRREARTRMWLRITWGALAMVGLLFAGAISLYLNLRKTKTAAAQSNIQWALRSAVEQINSGRPGEALAYAAHAVRVDPNNVIARRLAISLLLTKSWYVPEAAWRCDESVALVRFSSDDQRFLAVCGKRVYVTDVTSHARSELEHDDIVTDAHFAGSSLLVATSSGKRVTIWDVATRKPATTWTEADDVVLMNVSDDGSFVAAAMEDGRVSIRTAGRPAFQLAAEQRDVIRDLQFSRDGSRVAIIAERFFAADGAFSVWDIRTQTRLFQEKYTTTLNSADFDTDLSSIAIANEQGLVVRSFSGPDRLSTKETVRNVALSANNEAVLGILNGKVYVWRFGRSRSVDPISFGESILSAAFTRDGIRIMTRNEAGQVSFWSTVDGSLLAAPIAQELAVASAAASADGRRVVTASGPFLRLFSTTGTLQVTIPATNALIRSGRGTTLFAGHLANSSDRGLRYRVEALNVSDGMRIPQNEIVANQWLVPSIGTRIIWENDEGWQMLDYESGKRIRLKDTPAVVGRLAVSGDGNRLIVIPDLESSSVSPALPRGRRDDTAILYDLTTGTGRELRDIATGSGRSLWDIAAGEHGVDLNHDGTLALIKTSRETVLLDLVTGDRLHEIEGHSSVQFDPTRRYLVLAAGRTARVVNPRTLESIGREIADSSRIRYAMISRDDKRLVTASFDGVVNVWDRNSGAKVGPPVQHPHAIEHADFSTGSELILTRSDDDLFLLHRIRIWHIASGTPIVEPFETQIRHIRFDVDGSSLAVEINGSGRVLRFDAASAAEGQFLADLAERVSGFRFDQTGGGLASVEPAPIQMPPQMSGSLVSKMAECFFSKDIRKRRLTPFTDTTVEEFIDERLIYSRGEGIARDLALLYPGAVRK